MLFAGSETLLESLLLQPDINTSIDKIRNVEKYFIIVLFMGNHPPKIDALMIFNLTKTIEKMFQLKYQVSDKMVYE